MSIVDAHAHWFCRTFFEALADESPLPGTREEKLADLASRTGLELPPEDHGAHTARWLAQLDQHGVEHLVAFASHPSEAAPLATALASHPERLSGIALIHPLMDGAAARAEQLLGEMGYRGLLFFPAQHGYRIDDPRAQEVLAVANRARALCYVHCGLFTVPLRDKMGIARTAQPALADPLHLVPAADRAPEARFVIPHFGAGMFREALMAATQCPNIVLDSSSSNSWIGTQATEVSLKQVFERTLAAVGATRLVFGTDSSVFPRGWREDRLAEQRAILEQLGANAEESAAVLGGNARSLLGRAGS